jgi:hypothetical protein
MVAKAGQLGLFTGRAVSTCEVCGRALSHPASVAAGIGPVCAGGKRAQRLAATCDDPESRELNGLRPFDVVRSEPWLGDRLAFGRIGKDAAGAMWSNVPHHVFLGKSPDGFNFGYSGSGPSEFGINIAQALLLMLEFEGDKYYGEAKWGGGWCFSAAWPLGHAVKNKYLVGVDPMVRSVYYETPDLLRFAWDWLTENGYADGLPADAGSPDEL